MFFDEIWKPPNSRQAGQDGGEKVMNQQICHHVLAGIPFLVVPRYHEMELCLLNRIHQSNASQVLVAGKMQNHVDPEHLQDSLGEEWTVWSCSEPTHNAVNALLESFADAINERPSKSHICFCPTGPIDLQNHFISRVRTPVALAMYVMGLTGELPGKDMLKFKECIGLLPAGTPVSSTLECIISADDPDISIRTQEAIRIALRSEQPVDKLLVEAIELFEHIKRRRLGVAIFVAFLILAVCTSIVIWLVK